VTERYGIHAHLTALGIKRILQNISDIPEKDQYDILFSFLLLH
jgi:hypothetical protein